MSSSSVKLTGYKNTIQINAVSSGNGHCMGMAEEVKNTVMREKAVSVMR